jgi:hypothetical protein
MHDAGRISKVPEPFCKSRLYEVLYRIISAISEKGRTISVYLIVKHMNMKEDDESVE